MSIFMRIKFTLVSIIRRNTYFLTSISVFLLGVILTTIVFFDFIPITPKMTHKQNDNTVYFRVSAIQLMEFVTHTDDILDDRLKLFFDELSELEEDEFSIDYSELVDVNGELTPMLLNSKKKISIDKTIPERFYNETGAYSAFFVKNGDDFISIATSVRDEEGELQLGKKLRHNQFAYQKLIQGESYFCPVMLYGKQLIAKYFPIYDDKKEVIGAIFVGVDLFEKNQVPAYSLEDLGRFSH
ncbi:Cache 3/Cache 2 fusion domain-containing protein [Thorsellia kenyensis]|uniref:Cache 3/Cache 2 fusion domain-containing protein n=1 Tax=Thorsellia kenyensis TaxID=1549888 RepID=A0ABV6C6V5_9GAMM